MVVGAGGALGEATALALLRKGWVVTAGMRKSHSEAADRLRLAGARVETIDLERPRALIIAAPNYEGIVFTNNLQLTERVVADLEFLVPRLVAFSSNNVAVHADGDTYQNIALAEAALRKRCPHATIIRPTLIYGDPRLITVTRLMRMAMRWPVLPMPGTGQVKVQPVYYEDLGKLAAGLLTGDGSGGGVFAVGGPDVVTMRDFFEVLQSAAGVRRPVVPITGPVLKLVGRLGIAGIHPEQVARSERDRTVVEQDPLPADLVPRVTLREGLARLASALR